MDDGLPLYGLIYNTSDDSCISEKTTIILAGDVKTDELHPYDNLDEITEKISKVKERFPQKILGGVIRAMNLLYYPFGDNSFVNIMNIYAEKAFALAQGGAEFIFVRGITSVAHCRAVVLGVRQTGLPVVLEVKPNSSFELENCTSVASALIVSQSLGAYAFCIQSDDVGGAIENIEKLSPYAMIPLLFNTDYSKVTQSQLMDMDKYCSPCVNISLLNEETLQKFSKIFDKESGSRYSYNDMKAIVSATEYEPFFLDEMFEISPALQLEDFDEDLILELENSKYDVIGIQILHDEDIFSFVEHAHLFTKPVALSCDDMILMEKALLLYMGRAFINSAYCEIEDEQLAQIARGYGAILR